MSEFIVGKIQQLMDGKQENTIADLQRQLAEAKAEIEAMRPVVEACKARYEHHNPWDSTIPCYCLTCQWYRDYVERKQP